MGIVTGGAALLGQGRVDKFLSLHLFPDISQGAGPAGVRLAVTGITDLFAGHDQEGGIVGKMG